MLHRSAAYEDRDGHANGHMRYARVVIEPRQQSSGGSKPDG
jgi:hypothetical protein